MIKNDKTKLTLEVANQYFEGDPTEGTDLDKFMKELKILMDKYNVMEISCNSCEGYKK